MQGREDGTWDGVRMWRGLEGKEAEGPVQDRVSVVTEREGGRGRPSGVTGSECARDR